MDEVLYPMNEDQSIVTPRNQIDQTNNARWYDNGLSENPISVENVYTTPKEEEIIPTEYLKKVIIKQLNSVDSLMNVKNKYDS